MPLGQIALTSIISILFVVLIVGAIAAVMQLRESRPVARLALCIAITLFVVACWGWTLVPREASTAHGPATCIEEPLMGLVSSTDLAGSNCAEINRKAVSLSLTAASVVFTATLVCVRSIQRGRRMHDRA